MLHWQSIKEAITRGYQWLQADKLEQFLQKPFLVPKPVPCTPLSNPTFVQNTYSSPVPASYPTPDPTMPYSAAYPATAPTAPALTYSAPVAAPPAPQYTDTADEYAAYYGAQSLYPYSQGYYPPTTSAGDTYPASGYYSGAGYVATASPTGYDASAYPQVDYGSTGAASYGTYYVSQAPGKTGYAYNYGKADGL